MFPADVSASARTAARSSSFVLGPVRLALICMSATVVNATATYSHRFEVSTRTWCQGDDRPCPALLGGPDSGQRKRFLSRSNAFGECSCSSRSTMYEAHSSVEDDVVSTVRSRSR